MLDFVRSTSARVPGVVLLLVRLGLGCIFLSSSLPKIRQPYDFLGSVYNYQLVGPSVGLVVAMVLPWVELIVGICLIAGIFTSGALLVSVGMAAMFTFALAATLYRGLAISCGCFSAAGGDMVSYMTLIRATVILFVSASAYAVIVLCRPRNLDPTTAIPE